MNNFSMSDLFAGFVMGKGYNYTLLDRERDASLYVSLLKEFTTTLERFAEEDFERFYKEKK